MTTRAEFHAGLKIWLESKKIYWTNAADKAPPGLVREHIWAKEECISELLDELGKATAFENRFPWEVK